MRLRNYTDNDFLRLQSLLKKCGIYGEIYDTEESLRKKIKHDPESIIVAEEGGKIIGCVFIIYDPWSSFIYRLGVLPKYRRKGLGTKLMEEAERILKERGTNPITLFVREDNGEVIDFYKKRGWKLGDKIFDMEK